MTTRLFFSIIVPAYNEEEYLDGTLHSIEDIDYPDHLYEAIVVENGSDDRTYKLAKQYRSNDISVYSLQEANKAKALNFGFTKVSRQSDWVIFLDADTILDTSFLIELNTFLQKEPGNRVIGTTRVLPLEEESLRASLWFSFDNWVHRLAKVPFGYITITKTQIAKKCEYDENLPFSEDQRFGRDCLEFGEFLFMQTRSVCTSTRRFEQVGYFTQGLKWFFKTLLPDCIKEKIPYKTIR